PSAGANGHPPRLHFFTWLTPFPFERSPFPVVVTQLLLVRFQRMDGAPERNPLGLVVAAFVITLPFDYDAYLIHRDLSESPKRCSSFFICYGRVLPGTLALGSPQ